MTRQAKNSAGETRILLIDLAWRPEHENETPPIDAVVRLWPVNEGEVGKFGANPDYMPADENSPSDPLDAAIRLVVRGVPAPNRFN